MGRIELGTVRYFGPVEWKECENLRDAVRTAQYLVDYNLAYPISIRVDGVERWRRLPDERLGFRWRKAAAA